jgi:O-methyltransferase
MSDARSMYLDLMKKCLLNLIYQDSDTQGGRPIPYNEKSRVEGRRWPTVAHSMVGQKRLDNVQFCIEDVLSRGVPGDLMETGVWRGGVVILMRAVLKAHGVVDRRIWAADSFEGLPPPNAEKYPADAGLHLNKFEELAISQEQVQENFRRYGLLDEQVHFLKGWFRDTLPTAPVKQIAVLRLDGDLYESTMDSLTHLYPKLVIGGYIIIDDYGDIAACRKAVTDYRQAHGITESIVQIDWTGAYWKKEK